MKIGMKKKVIFTGIVLVIIVLLLCVLCWSASSQEENLETDIKASAPAAETEALAETNPPTAPADVVTIDTTICPIMLPAQYSQLLEHREVIQDEITMEIFYMLHGKKELELFRLYFNPEESEADIGVLETKDGRLFVSLSLSVYEEFEDTEMREQYETVIGCVDTVVSSVRTNSQFRKKGDIEIKTTYREIYNWNFTLPENMEWEESKQSDSYRITFLGNVNEEKIKLFSVLFGLPELKSNLGYYMLNEHVYPVSIESHELPITDDWEEDDINMLYTMMDSINTVIQTITMDEAFLKELPQ